MACSGADEVSLDNSWQDIDHLTSSYASAQAAIATLYNEVLIVKNDMDNVVEERDKFKSDIRVYIDNNMLCINR